MCRDLHVEYIAWRSGQAIINSYRAKRLRKEPFALHAQTLRNH
jgi:hypothetical protein